MIDVVEAFSEGGINIDIDIDLHLEGGLHLPAWRGWIDMQLGFSRADRIHSNFPELLADFPL